MSAVQTPGCYDAEVIALRIENANLREANGMLMRHVRDIRIANKQLNAQVRNQKETRRSTLPQWRPERWRA